MKHLTQLLEEINNPAEKGWKNPRHEERFITDNGAEIPLKNSDTGEVVMVMPRYGAWGDKGRGKPETIEVSNDLKKLQFDHDVPDTRVVDMTKFSYHPDIK